jgi:hypothetical protein
MSEERAGRDRPRARPRRRRGVPGLVVVAAVVVAFLVGAGVGYLVRGAPEPSGELTVERSVPVVTVTVEEPAPAP